MTSENNTDNSHAAEATTNERTVSDSQLILAPLAKYAAIAVIMVSIIVTSAVMLDRDMSDVNKELADLQAEIAESNAIVENSVKPATVESTVAVIETKAADNSATSSHEKTEIASNDNDSTPTETVVSVTDASPVTEISASTETVDAEPAVKTAIKDQPATVLVVAAQQPAATVMYTAFDPDSRIRSMQKDMYTRIEERNEYLKTVDNKSLENLRARQQKMIDMMFEQIARLQTDIEEMREHDQAYYALRAAALKRMQLNREQRLERI